jgi:hypothetical protein
VSPTTDFITGAALTIDGGTNSMTDRMRYALDADIAEGATMFKVLIHIYRGDSLTAKRPYIQTLKIEFAFFRPGKERAEYGLEFELPAVSPCWRPNRYPKARYGRRDSP